MSLRSLRRLHWVLGTTAAAAFLLGTGSGCGQLDKYRRKLPGGAMLDKLAPSLSPQTAAMVHALGPLAVQAAGAVAVAVERHVAEKRAIDAAEQERQRVRIASQQLFYAEACTVKGPAGTTFGGGAQKEAEDAFARGDHAAALAGLQKARAAETARSGENSLAVAHILNREAVAQLAMGNFADAMGPALKAHKVRGDHRDSAPKQDKAGMMFATLELAESEATLGQIYLGAGMLTESEGRLAQALKLRQDNLGSNHLCVASSENSLGELEIAAGAYGRGLARFRHALDTRRAQLPANHGDLAQSFDNLASAYKAMALYGHATDAAKQALTIRKTHGADHPDVANSLHSLGTIAKAEGDYATAESYFQDALAIRKQRQPDSLEEAQSENALGDLYFATGAFDKAAPRLLRAIELRKRRLSPDHPQIAESTEGLARLYQAKGDEVAAERAFNEALAIWEKKLGPNNLAVARGLSSLGSFHVAVGRYDKAEPALGRARTIREAQLGADHPEVAEAIFNLGQLAYARRDYAAAEPLFKTAAERQQKKLGRRHVQVALSLSYQAATMVALGRGAPALPLFTEAQQIAEQVIRNVGSTSSEARLESLLMFLRTQEEVVYSLLDERTLSAKAGPLALALALLRKGRAIDEAAMRSRLLHETRGSADDVRVQELSALRTEIASKLLRGGGSDAELQKASERAEALEQELAKEVAAFRGQQTLPSLDKVVAAVAGNLGKGEALVEIVAYRHYDFAAKGKLPHWGEVRYTALTLDRAGVVTVVALGAGGAVDAAVKQVLAQVTDEKGSADATVGAELGKLVATPLASTWTSASRVYLSPDGQLNLVPFWALPLDKKLLIDTLEIAYVTSGRDLLRPVNPAPGTQVVVMAKPDFVPGMKGRGDDTRALELVDGPATAAAGTSSAGGSERGGLRLKAAPSPLLGTAQEASAIKQILPRASTITGARASKEALLGLQAPGILHVATHGLFRSVGTPTRRSRGLLLEEHSSAGNTTGGQAVSDPLVSSMLLMANAGRPAPGGEGVVLDPRGLVTAREISSMNLWGTQLVVLSACESGRGRVDNLGQGVYGLRRALVVAGAETLVTSLWKVDDKITRDLMTQYYRNLKRGGGRVEALRQAALAVRAKHPEPRFWAPFIGIGQSGLVRKIGG